MSDLAKPHSIQGLRMARKQWPIFLCGAGLLLGSIFAAESGLAVAAIAAGASMIVAAAILSVPRWVVLVRRRLLISQISQVFRHDTAAVVATAEGRALWWNKSVAGRSGGFDTAKITAILGKLFAAPEDALNRLRLKAMQEGSASEDRVSRNAHIRISVQSAGLGVFVWRKEDVSPTQAAVGSLCIAMPIAVVDEEGRIKGRNQALNDLVDADLTQLDDLIVDGPYQPGRIHAVRTKEGTARRRVVAIEGTSGMSEYYFLSPECNEIGDPAELFESLSVPLMKLGADGRILVANGGARELLGANGIGAHSRLQDMLSGLGRSVRDWLEEAAAGRGTNRSEFLQVVSSDVDRFVQVSLKRIQEEGEDRLMAVLTDATELKTLEAQFVQSQKMQAIGQLAGGVAHDFNNLLTAISGHCDLLLLRHDQGDPEYGDLVQIHQNANRAASLVGQLLAFSRKQTLQPEVVDIRDTLSDLAHLLNRLVGERVSLMLRHGESLPQIRADKRQLEQVIMNLVVNARDAMPEGGEIAIDTQAVTLDSEIRRSRAVVPAGDYVLVRVTDQGVGIAPDKIQKIFEPFFTTKKTGEGTGLGLSTAYGIVKQTGGFIFADSVLGEGTQFTIYLPAHAAPQEVDQREKPTGNMPNPREGVVLLVEDEAPVRAFASRALNLQGLTVIEAENAEDALDCLADPDLKVDVFVTDVVMPGMDGPTWVQIALKDRPDTRVVFVSGYAEDALSDHQVDIPNSVFLPKPFSLQDLTSTVKAQLM